MSTRVNLDDLEVGMILADDAVHINGRVLLSEGACLTDRHLNMFRTWGLTEASIRGSGNEGVAKKSVNDVDANVIIQSELALKNNFLHMDLDAEPVAELFKICVKMHAEKLSVGKGDGNNS